MEFKHVDRAFRKEMRREGYTLNIAEFEAVSVLKSAAVDFSRRGYPDYMILRDDEIAGFVEVKPNQRTSLRKGQEKFKRLCERVGVPFLRWSPDDGAQALLEFARTL